MNMTFTHIVRQ